MDTDPSGNYPFNYFITADRALDIKERIYRDIKSLIDMCSKLE